MYVWTQLLDQNFAFSYQFIYVFFEEIFLDDPEVFP
jgi:hypothetical protein